ncbi:Uncharacterized conserved protein YafD, endonuclease/exonuclease/phosphatase (EEP) superfamily [Colwellia chukchiensis]|uniref:Uncharacterized conserved protein YafD, endonuclease/exonuclease/phosphatase (EEP) superfamily n=1 Tax=Colwellia chukchiensis TaxID=641665 RepID=A0A1H7SFV8_9GAMM|nr:endonuclease/exonuclease/phosphatase family protein [Colwellia chukchiensis]SEL71066.1 Uncharacterized conserved protein YafD, endonuclease/exonuclease/phosphatase (EEP) superfamily [Colwellia chukchiensis]
MKNKQGKKQGKIIKRLGFGYFIGCCLISLLVTLLPYWPHSNSLIIAKYALLFGPRWWLLVVVLGLFCFWRYLSMRQRLLSPLLILLSLNYLDLQLPSMGSYFSASTGPEISLLSANIGGGGSIKSLENIGFGKKPDIVLLQEARRVSLAKVFSHYPYKECVSGLCIFSQFPFQKTQVLNRRLFGGWGDFAVFYQVHTPLGTVSLANVHFETPRSILMGLIYRYFDFQLAKSVESNRQFESDLVSLWSQSTSNTFIVGDFNMPQDENIYQRNFSHLNNAIDTKGIGFNATKHTSWYGVRIDHILYSDDFKITAVEVIDSSSGDHRPVMATFRLAK